MKFFNSKKKQKLFIILMLTWPIIHWLIFTLYMNIQTLIYSFKHFNHFKGKMQFVLFNNYIELFDMFMNNTNSIAIAFRNTFLWLLLNVFVIVPIALLVAYILSKKVPFYRFFNTVFFIPNIVSIVILTMIWAFMWDPNQGVVNGLLDILGLSQYKMVWLGDHRTALGNVFLYCVWAGIGWNNLIIGGAISKIPSEIFEAAAIDGVDNFREFIHIILPSVWPTIATVTLIGSAAAFRVFLHPKLLTNGKYDTASVALKLVESVTDTGEYGMASSIGITIAVLGFIAVYIIKYQLDRVEKYWS